MAVYPKNIPIMQSIIPKLMTIQLTILMFIRRRNLKRINARIKNQMMLPIEREIAYDKLINKGKYFGILISSFCRASFFLSLFRLSS